MKFIQTVGTKLSKLGKRGKAVLTTAIVAASMSAMAISASAADGTVPATNAYSTMGDSLKAGFTDMVTNTMSVLSSIIPIGIGVFGAYMCVGYAKKFFKKVTA